MTAPIERDGLSAAPPHWTRAELDKELLCHPDFMKRVHLWARKVVGGGMDDLLDEAPGKAAEAILSRKTPIGREWNLWAIAKLYTESIMKSELRRNYRRRTGLSTLSLIAEQIEEAA